MPLLERKVLERRSRCTAVGADRTVLAQERALRIKEAHRASRQAVEHVANQGRSGVEIQRKIDFLMGSLRDAEAELEELRKENEQLRRALKVAPDIRAAFERYDRDRSGRLSPGRSATPVPCVTPRATPVSARGSDDARAPSRR